MISCSLDIEDYKREIFDRDLSLWCESRRGVSSTKVLKQKCCGDCCYHIPAGSGNSASYTQCFITGRSVTFGSRCHCDKWILSFEVYERSRR